jgi:hypothetical protein
MLLALAAVSLSDVSRFVMLGNAADDNMAFPAVGLGTGCAIGGCDGQHPNASYSMAASWLQLGGRRFDGADSVRRVGGVLTPAVRGGGWREPTIRRPLARSLLTPRSPF